MKKQETEKVKFWYKNNRKDLKRIFDLFLNSIKNNNIKINEDIENIYKEFIYFSYYNSNTSI